MDGESFDLCPSAACHGIFGRDVVLSVLHAMNVSSYGL